MGNIGGGIIRIRGKLHVEKSAIREHRLPPSTCTSSLHTACRFTSVDAWLVLAIRCWVHTMRGSRWGCSCQGFSDRFHAAHQVSFGTANETERQWWVHHHCHTEFRERPPPPPGAASAIYRSTADEDAQCGWRPETIAGSCVGSISATPLSRTLKTAKECADECCKLPADKGNGGCITWQFREKEGCFHGGDVRIGMEKDGVTAWCEPNPPARWSGQRLKVNGVDVREQACSDQDFNPTQLEGQCFGLGPRRAVKEESAKGCRDACCNDPKIKCETWQWRVDAGCYYEAKSPSKCDDPDAGAFQGRRKRMSERTYIPLWNQGRDV